MVHVETGHPQSPHLEYEGHHGAAAGGRSVAAVAASAAARALLAAWLPDAVCGAIRGMLMPIYVPTSCCKAAGQPRC